jgi:two-component system sensor histidine kinase DegS
MRTVRLAREAASGGLARELAIEEERRRIARDLHDGPAQTLAAALLGVDIAIAAVDRSPETARTELRGARVLVQDAIDDVRALMTGLRLRLLEERGLVGALRSLAAAPPLWGPHVSVATSGLAAELRLPPDVELGLFRIAQEAISNARRHGAGSLVTVQLDVSPEAVTLEVVDDGRGFAVEGVVPALDRGEGLPGMRERASLLGGELFVASAPGSGTRIRVWLPLSPAITRIEEGRG